LFKSYEGPAQVVWLWHGVLHRLVAATMVPSSLRAPYHLYHATLVAHGVTYDRRALDDDYRLSVLWQITTPVWQAANNIPPVIWWNNLERILLAVDDLGCRDLLA